MGIVSFHKPIAVEEFVDWLPKDIDVLPSDTMTYQKVPVDPDASRCLGTSPAVRTPPMSRRLNDRLLVLAASIDDNRIVWPRSKRIDLRIAEIKARITYLGGDSTMIAGRTTSIVGMLFLPLTLPLGALLACGNDREIKLLYQELVRLQQEKASL